MRLEREVEELGLFDEGYYRRCYMQGRDTAGLVPLRHYLEIGVKELSKPHPLIDPAYISQRYGIAPDSNMLAFLVGKGSRVESAHPIFDRDYYQRTNGRAGGWPSPFLHYLNEGSARNLAPSTFFEPTWYGGTNPDLPPNLDLAVHFLEHALRDYIEGGLSRQPCWWFDLGYYQNATGVLPPWDVVSHFVMRGCPSGQAPCYLFSELDLFPDGSFSYEQLSRSLSRVEKNGAELFADRFSADYYLSLYHDLSCADVDPVHHFASFGQREGRAHFERRSMTGVCIVTPDTVGPVKNGGIGTACYHYAISLAKQGVEVTVLFTGWLDLGDLTEWRDHYRTLGVEFEWLGRVEPVTKGQAYGSGPALEPSLALADFLRKQEFSCIFFQDWHANGFWSIREKQLGLGFLETPLKVIVHSPQKWQDEGMRRLPEDVWENSKQRWAERYSIEHADAVLCPSHHMRRWLVEQGFRVEETTQIAPYTYNFGQQSGFIDDMDRSHLVFFGRLEKRKGLDVFVEAIGLLDEETRRRIKKVSFLGKHAFVDQRSSVDIVWEFGEAMDCPVQVETEFSAEEAIAYLMSEKAIAVVPSTLDNLPLVVIECISHGIPIVASDAGGIPELLPKDLLFECRPEPLSVKLAGVLNGEVHWDPVPYDSAAATARILEASKKSGPAAKGSQRFRSRSAGDVTVCIPFFNHHQYLGSLLDALADQTMQPGRVVLVDDGSTEGPSGAALEEIRARRLPFVADGFTIENSGPGAARNYAVQKSDTEYVIFLDADNLPEPDFVEVLKSAAEHSGLDAVFCGFNIRLVSDEDPEGELTYERFVPLAGYVDNVMGWNDNGDTSMIIKRDVFERAGGFDERRGVHEDWLFVIRLMLDGAAIGSTYRSLLQYRSAASSRSQQMSEFSHSEAVWEMMISAPEWAKNEWLEKLMWSAIAASGRLNRG